MPTLPISPPPRVLDSFAHRKWEESLVLAINEILAGGGGGTTTIVGITGTKAEFNTALTDGDFVYQSDFVAFVGDSGAGGVIGLVPAPIAGDATKYLKGNGTWATIAGGGDALVANPLSQFAATTSLQLKNTISDETGSDALVFATLPTFNSWNIVTTSSSTVGVIFQNSNRLLHTYGTLNLFLGTNAGNFTMSGTSNVGIGSTALFSVTSGVSNVAVGKEALYSLQDAQGNFGLGARALYSNVSGYGNVAIGLSAAESTTGDSNIAIGVGTLQLNVGGSSNVAIGRDAMVYGTSPGSNVAIGRNALLRVTGSTNVALGRDALSENTSASDSVAIGYLAGVTVTGANANTTGGTNTFIGSQSGQASATQRTGVICIGYRALVDASNTCVIGGTQAAGTAVDTILGGTTASAKLHIIKTSEQLRVGYDASNYYSTTISSAGAVTFNAVGASSGFIFSDDVFVPDEAYGAGWDGDLSVPTKNAVYDKIQTISGGSATINETEVDFGTVPTWSKTFIVTDAAVTATSKIMPSQSGNVATDRVGDDYEWDSIAYAAKGATGTFTLTANVNPGPIVGKRKVFYQVAA